jgi:hypothetical protein
MSYKNDSYQTILSSYGKASSAAKAELFETYDRIRDLAAAGPVLGGSGLGKFSSLLMNVARMFGSSAFLPTFGSEAITIPGTSYYAPITGGTGILPGGQAAFGLAPLSYISGFPGGAAPIDGSGVTPLSMFSSFGSGSNAASALGFSGIGQAGFPAAGFPWSEFPGSGFMGGGAASIDGMSGELDGGFRTVGASPVDSAAGTLDSGFGSGVIAGGASGISTAATAGGLTMGTAAGAGFGRNWVMPAAGIMSGIGGLLTTLGPFFGPFGLAAAAGGAVMNGVSGAVLSSFQHVSNRLLVNADTILAAKVKNLETLIKQLDAQEDIVKKLLKDSAEGDKKALDNL